MDKKKLKGLLEHKDQITETDSGTLKKLIDAKKQSAFVDDYKDKATDEEALGLLIAGYFEWDGLAILKTLYSALEDANFHTENKTISDMIDNIEGGGSDAIRPPEGDDNGEE